MPQASDWRLRPETGQGRDFPGFLNSPAALAEHPHPPCSAAPHQPRQNKADYRCGKSSDLAVCPVSAPFLEENRSELTLNNLRACVGFLTSRRKIVL
jgi:hypothetical protein